MAVAKIWHYSGDRGDEANTKTSLPREPYVSRQSVTTSAIAANSAASPAGTYLAGVEVTVNTRYRVRLPGDNTLADANDVPLGYVATGYNVFCIHLPPGATISLIEA